jgi:chemotaxis protein methyltransferase CheR
MGLDGLELKPRATFELDMEEKGFDLLKNMILKKLGLDCSYYRDNYLRRRLQVRMNAQGTRSYWDYVRLLKANPAEYDRLIKDLTINYTKFFRDPDVFSFFRTNIFPQVLKEKKNIRILSAGCSSGEEPYTLSMIVDDVLGPRINEYLISVYAVDIDQKCLKKAESGEYEKREVAELNKVYIDRYFVKKNYGYQVNDTIRRLVHFGYMDLTQELKHRMLDVIFCRNVFIYFAKPAQATIFMRFYEALGKNGYLIIGKSEMLPDEMRDKFRWVSPECRVLQKNNKNLQ